MRQSTICGLLLVSLLAGAAPAQEPDEPIVPANPFREDALPDAPVMDEGSAEDDELPTLPDIIVPGRPNPFPANPLSADTVVTPSRGQTLIGETGSSVTVISSEEIAASGQTHVLGVLQGVVGLDVVQQSNPGSVTSVFMRGANSEHTKVLLDGIPLSNPANPTRAFDFGNLTLDNVERIEVVRGPQSVVYGSDAIGGVINIITKRGQGPMSFQASAMGGTYGTHQERIGVSGGDCLNYYSFGASYRQSDGFSSVSRRFGGIEDDGYRNASFSGRYGWTPSEELNVDYVFRYTDSDVDIDGFLVDNLIRQTRSNQFFNRVQLQSLTMNGIIEQKLGFSLTDNSLIDTDPGFFGTPRFEGRSRLLDYQANILLLDNACSTNTFTAGADYLHEEGTPFNSALQTQFLRGAYLQDRMSFGNRSHSTIGVRWDDHSTAGKAQTYRFTQVFDIDETDSRVHGSIGRGFRAPAIAQRFGFAGNPNLRPEFSKGWDVGFEQSLYDGDLVLDATYFRNDFQDLIQFVFDPLAANGFGLLQNVQLADAMGVEFTATAVLTCDTTVSVAYTYTDTEDLLNNRRLLRRPRNKVGLSIYHRCLNDRASLNAFLRYASNRQDFDAVGGIVELGDYITLHLSGTYELDDSWELFGRVNNLTDSDYEEVFGFATPGVWGYAGLQFSH